MDNELLNLRHNYIDKEIESLMTEINVQLPKTFQQFLTKYKLGKDCLNYKRYYREDIDDYDIIGPIGFIDSRNNDEILINYFLDLDEIKSSWIEYDRLEETGKRNLLQFAYLSSDPNGGLYIGIGQQNQGEIWVVNWDRGDNRFLKVCDDFQELLSKLKQLEE